MKHLKTPQELNEASENLNISDVSDSDFDEISDKVLEYFEKLGKNKEEVDVELKKIISSELKKIFDFFYS
jgi:hypothetical protein